MTAHPPRRRSRLLPELELEVMKILWRRGEARVADVQESLAVERPLAYTTVMTVLDRLTRKSAASRRKAGRSYVYSPHLSQEAARRMALDRLLDDFFDNSPRRLEAHLRNESRPPSPAGRAEGMDSSLL